MIHRTPMVPHAAAVPEGLPAATFETTPLAPMEWIEHAVCASIGAYSILLLLSVAGQV